MSSPAREEAREFWTKLHDVICWALDELHKQEGEEIAREIARRLDRREMRLMTRAEVDDNGQPKGAPDTALWYRVDVRTDNGWLGLVEARASALGVTEETARDEIRLTALQHGIGVPDDPSGLTDPPTGDPEA